MGSDIFFLDIIKCDEVRGTWRNSMEKWMVIAKRADFNEIGKRFSIDPVIARIIRNRDVIGEEAIELYLHGTVEHLHEPRIMKDMEKAVEILTEKINNQKKIRVIGDYDIDGIQSTYILSEALKNCGARVDFAIPDRISDGYGLNQRLIMEAHKAGVDTIITCDNGIAAREEIALGKSFFAIKINPSFFKIYFCSCVYIINNFNLNVKSLDQNI